MAIQLFLEFRAKSFDNLYVIRYVSMVGCLKQGFLKKNLELHILSS